MIRIGFRHRWGAIVATHRLDTGLHLAPVLQVVGSPPDVGALRLGLGDHGDRRRAGANALRRHRSRRNEGAARAGQAREQQQGERACHESVQVCSSQWFLVVSQGGAQKKRVCKLTSSSYLPVHYINKHSLLGPTFAVLSVARCSASRRNRRLPILTGAHDASRPCRTSHLLPPHDDSQHSLLPKLDACTLSCSRSRSAGRCRRPSRTARRW